MYARALGTPPSASSATNEAMTRPRYTDRTVAQSDVRVVGLRLCDHARGAGLGRQCNVALVRHGRAHSLSNGYIVKPASPRAFFLCDGARHALLAPRSAQTREGSLGCLHRTSGQSSKACARPPACLPRVGLQGVRRATCPIRYAQRRTPGSQQWPSGDVSRCSAVPIALTRLVTECPCMRDALDLHLISAPRGRLQHPGGVVTSACHRNERVAARGIAAMARRRSMTCSKSSTTCAPT